MGTSFRVETPELIMVWGPTIILPPTFHLFYLQEPHRVLMLKAGENSSCASGRSKGKVKHFEIHLEHSLP